MPPPLDDWIDPDNPVRVIDAFVEGLDLGALGFEPCDTVGPAPDYIDWCFQLSADAQRHISTSP
jgi:hypothetical protein